MEASISFEQTEQRRRAAIALFIAATFGLTTLLSLPGVRLIPFPFRFPSAEVLGPPEPVPPAIDWSTGSHPGKLGRLRGHTQVAASIREGPRPPESNQGSGSSGDGGRSPILPMEEAVPSSTLNKDKVPQPPASDEEMSKEKWDVLDGEAEQNEGGK